MEDKKLNEILGLAVESMGVAITLIDTEGNLLYYNKQAVRILDRKPGYIGTNIHSHHKKVSSNKKLDQMLQAFCKGRADPFHYEAKLYGETILITLSPIFKKDKFIGCVQSVQLSIRGRD